MLLKQDGIEKHVYRLVQDDRNYDISEEDLVALSSNKYHA